jgi:hypothetical protein
MVDAFIPVGTCVIYFHSSNHNQHGAFLYRKSLLTDCYSDADIGKS